MFCAGQERQDSPSPRVGWPYGAFGRVDAAFQVPRGGSDARRLASHGDGNVSRPYLRRNPAFTPRNRTRWRTPAARRSGKTGSPSGVRKRSRGMAFGHRTWREQVQPGTLERQSTTGDANPGPRPWARWDEGTPTLRGSRNSLRLARRRS